MTPEPAWLTVKEAAAYLQVKPRTLLKWVNEGRIPAYALSGRARRTWRFRRLDLDAALLSRAVVSCDSPTVLSERRSH